MNWIERLLCKVFPYTDILRDGTNDLYLRRWFIYPRNKDLSKNREKGRLYLHKFYRGDEDPHMHDHPWKFKSLILTRGYWEETYSKDTGDVAKCQKGTWSWWDEDSMHRYRVFYPRFSILRRPADWKHRVVLKDKKPVWTLVRTGHKERNWGFWVMGRLCPWRQYGQGVCWCEERSESKSNTDVES